MREPCKHGAHAFVFPDFERRVVHCRYCPLSVEMRAVVAERGDDARALASAVRKAERDWYIEALES